MRRPRGSSVTKKSALPPATAGPNRGANDEEPPAGGAVLVAVPPDGGDEGVEALEARARCWAEPADSPMAVRASTMRRRPESAGGAGWSVQRPSPVSVIASHDPLHIAIALEGQSSIGHEADGDGVELTILVNLLAHKPGFSC